MNIVVFGGTTEGRELSAALASRGVAVTVCVATDYGREEQETVSGVTVLTGRRSEAEKLALLRNAALCVDATHPYATGISESVRAACAAAGIPYRRLLRGAMDTSLAVVVADAAEAAEYLRGTEGNIFLTTGAKELAAFAALPRQRLYARVLPSQEGIAACEAAGIPHRNIIAMQGPFSEELNAALLRQYRIAYLVTKDGGVAGGYPEKARAARQCGVKLVVLRRPEETGETMERILNEIEGLKQCK
ncbi:MAG: precorrin-6A reductase [Oscillospiraceae bacterium]|nr:precorrin-6A reductase [Oscillospiraceae bacterium]